MALIKLGMTSTLVVRDPSHTYDLLEKDMNSDSDAGAVALFLEDVKMIAQLAGSGTELWGCVQRIYEGDPDHRPPPAPISFSPT